MVIDFLVVFGLPQFIADQVPSARCIIYIVFAMHLTALVTVMDPIVHAVLTFLTFLIHMVVVLWFPVSHCLFDFDMFQVSPSANYLYRPHAENHG